MIVITEARESDKNKYNQVATHPLQSWEWGNFRKETGLSISRMVETKGKEIERTFQITWHRIPKTKFYIGYCPKSDLPTGQELKQIEELAKKRGAILVKFEPNIKKSEKSEQLISEVQKDFDFIKGKSLFTKYSFWLDISRSEETLLSKMHQKTRYNIRLAEKKGVTVVEDSTDKGFEDYWKLMEETTKRQGFYAHTKSYHQKMWKEMRESGMGHLFKAIYQGKVLTTWIIFILNGVMYYPYGASSNENREVMASNLMMWEVIKFGKKNGCKLMDMWGSMGPEPDIKDPWYGFHRFKQGYGPELIEFIGTYDLVIDSSLYKVYGVIDKVRWLLLKLMTKFR